ncbi:hypothetical protein Elgi_52730 [Paenibacillus elgii]|nr:hypothetical protein Elgi_52730 [Paenibacillus elgii]
MINFHVLSFFSGDDHARRLFLSVPHHARLPESGIYAAAPESALVLVIEIVIRFYQRQGEDLANLLRLNMLR